MRLHINPPLLDLQGRSLDAAGIMKRAKAVEDAGFDGLWIGDSFSPGMTRPDPLQWLLAAGAATTRIELGTCIFIVPLRGAYDVAQRFSTLHRLTNGRFTAGVGAGSTKNNYDAVGGDFEGRFKKLKSDLETIRALEKGETVDEMFLNPWPEALGGPPIVIGAWWNGVWLKRAAQEYEGWMCSAGRTNLTTMRDAISRFRDVGGQRAIISSCMVDLTAPDSVLHDDDPFNLRCGPEEAAERLHKVQELGFDDILLVKTDHTRSGVLHEPRTGAQTLSIYEADFTDDDLAQIRSLIAPDLTPVPRTVR
jgi:alkanesulfonate monooxygenase SsuD/methylene tetrahydromethanopterin reductase-like flavin-dependent oxidoreductase (luciferase family)